MQAKIDRVSGDPSPPSSAQVACVLLGALALWLLVRPYYGITHDALLYAATALRRLNPAAYAEDFYLTRNASDAYSLFPRLYAVAIGQFGLDRATRLLLSFGYLVWMTGAAVLCQALLPRRTALLALLFVCFLPARYGSLDILSYGEPYLTPRLFAEGGGLMALAALLRGWRLAALILFAAAALLHPLMTLPALGIGSVMLMLQDRRWLWLLPAGIGIAAALGAAGLPPFDRLWQQLDADWLAIARFRTPYLFFASWSYWNWANLAIDALLVWQATRVLTGAPRRLFLAGLATAALAYGVSFIAVDLGHNLLLTQLQTWRVGWLLRALSFIALAAIIMSLWQRREAAARPILLIYTMVALTLALEHQANLMAVCTLLILLIALPGHLALERGLALPGGRRLELLAVSLAGGLTLVVLATAIGHSLSWRAQLSGSGLSALLANEYLLDWLGIAALALCAWVVIRPPGRRQMTVALLFTGLTLLTAIAAWDRRSDWSLDLERRSIDLVALREIIPPEATVYWERGASLLWLTLQRTNYFSPTQGSGIIFDRLAAMTFERRRRLLLPLGTDDARAPFADSASRNRAGRTTTAEAVASVCAGSGTRERAPDILVLATRISELPHVGWRPAHPAPIFVYRDGGYRFAPIAEFHIYHCAALRTAGRL